MCTLMARDMPSRSGVGSFYDSMVWIGHGDPFGGMVGASWNLGPCYMVRSIDPTWLWQLWQVV